jgi:hypothetical protein
MKTDWNLIREMMATAIDSCERIEELGYSELHRDSRIEVNGNEISVNDIMVGAWTYPELIRYQIIRQRHAANADLPYVPETARILAGMAAACAELIKAADTKPAQADIEQMMNWYRRHALPALQVALAA